jgi:hypothetical protein
VGGQTAGQVRFSSNYAGGGYVVINRAIYVLFVPVTVLLEWEDKLLVMYAFKWCASCATGMGFVWLCGCVLPNQ